jgi:hypothetical protein
VNMKNLRWLVVIAFLVALGFGIRKAKAQAYEMQPFTAIETTTTRMAGMKIPSTDIGVLAVSGDGQLIAQLHQSQLTTANAMMRWVLNRKDKTSIVIDPGAKIKVSHQYHKEILNGKTARSHCDGTPDGQIEGFDVTLKQRSLNNGNSNIGTQKLWAAPKLGCFLLREERSETDKDGNFVRLTVHTLTNIVIGEPDFSYFDVSLPEGYVDAKPEDYKGAIVNHVRARDQQQQ